MWDDKRRGGESGYCSKNGEGGGGALRTLKKVETENERSGLVLSGSW